MKRLITLLTFIVFSFSGATFAQEEGAGGGGAGTDALQRALRTLGLVEVDAS